MFNGFILGAVSIHKTPLGSVAQKQPVPAALPKPRPTTLVSRGASKLRALLIADSERSGSWFHRVIETGLTPFCPAPRQGIIPRTPG